MKKLFVLTMMLLVASLSSAEQLPTAGSEKFDEDLAYELKQAKTLQHRSAQKENSGKGKSYQIIVMLKPIESLEELNNTFFLTETQDALEDNIKNLQDKVLTSIKTQKNMHFELIYRYQVLYGFSAYADENAINMLASYPEVISIETMKVYQQTSLDPEASVLTGTDLAHAAGWTGKGVTIAVIDSAIDHDNPAFGGHRSYPNAKIIGGYDFADYDNNPSMDCDNGLQDHGSQTAGIAAGNGGGITGVAPDAKIVMLKVSSKADCARGMRRLTGDVAAAMDWIIAHRHDYNIKVVSISLGLYKSVRGNVRTLFSSPCPAGNGPKARAIAQAVRHAKYAGLVVVASTGNDSNSNGMLIPACHPDVVSVGAVYDANVESYPNGMPRCDTTSYADKITCYSNSDTFIDILAPSNCAKTARSKGCFNGTSASAPYAAGIIATLFEKDPDLSRAEAIAAIKNTGTNITDDRNGVITPRVDHINALQAITENTDNNNRFTFIFQNHSYELVKKPRTWREALADAKSRKKGGVSGHLVHINSAAENNEIATRLQQFISSSEHSITDTNQEGGWASYVWIGANDRAKESKWVWDNGVQFWQGGVNGHSVNGSYTNWGKEPDNYKKKQDAGAIALTQWPRDGHLGKPSQWNDLSENNKLFYLIEYDNISTTPDTAIPETAKKLMLICSDQTNHNASYYFNMTGLARRDSRNIHCDEVTLKYADGTSRDISRARIMRDGFDPSTGQWYNRQIWEADSIINQNSHQSAEISWSAIWKDNYYLVANNLKGNQTKRRTRIRLELDDGFLVDLILTTPTPPKPQPEITLSCLGSNATVSYHSNTASLDKTEPRNIRCDEVILSYTDGTLRRVSSAKIMRDGYDPKAGKWHNRQIWTADEVVNQTTAGSPAKIRWSTIWKDNYYLAAQNLKGSQTKRRILIRLYFDDGSVKWLRVSP